MPVYNTVSSKRIISKIYRDLGLEDASFEIDAVEWIGEALEQIGAGMQLEEKVAQAQVQSHAAKLPHDCLFLNQVARVEHVGPDYARKPKREPLRLLASYEFSATENEREKNVYMRRGSYLYFPFETGLVVFYYKGIPLDEEGWPLVPDNAEFAEAFLWYVQMKLVLKGWQHPAGLDYPFVQREWKRARASAKAEANMPDMPELERFRVSWVKAMQFPDRFERGFGSGGASSASDGSYGTGSIDVRDLGPDN